jgi:hypothetical protein
MLNWRRSWVHLRTGTCGPRMAGLYPLCSPPERRLSRDFFAGYLAGRGTGGLTAIGGIGEGPGLFADAGRMVESGAGHGDLADRLMSELRGDVTDIAVSGGTDSWLLAALLKSHGCAVRGWYLESGVPGYCERDQVLRMAASVGVECEILRVTAGDFVLALPAFVAQTETPIYNLHPVSKWLFARALARRGVKAIVSGDGADQVFRHDWNCDLLPLTLTCFESVGVRLIAPFLSESVISGCRVPSPDKAPVRDLARRLGVPETAKRATLFPPIEGLPVAHRSTRLLRNSLKERSLCAASPA